MAKERGVIMPVIRAFISSLKSKRTKQELKGVDYNGTKYYENPDARRQRGRSFVPHNKDDFMQEIPAEWEAWLRYRRSNPPTDEEVNTNRALMMIKKKNAAELEEKYALERGNVSEKPLGISEESTKFPTYQDYTTYGQEYLNKSKK